MANANDAHTRCQSVMLGTYKYFGNPLTDSYERLGSMKRLLREESCTELYPRLKEIAEEIRAKEEAQRALLLSEPTTHMKEINDALVWLERSRTDDTSTPARRILEKEKAKIEQREIAYRVLKDYQLKQEIEPMLRMRIRYEIWCQKHQPLLLSAFTFPLSFMIGSHIFSTNYRISTKVALLCSWILVGGTWAEAVSNRKRYI